MNDKELETLTKGISKILSWYSLGNKDGDLLTSAKQKLIGYCYRFSVLVGESLAEYNKAYNFRKRNLAQKKLEYIQEGDTAAKADLKAELKNYKFRVDEGEAEALYRRVKSQFDLIRDTISSMQQDISTLKKEKEDAKIHN
tara:strand:+ start:206 stop:628 length:423 start_codon:yes stop_codon:yes gene_type:complete